MVWLSEEIHHVNCEPSIVLVEHGDFISEKFELVPGLFSKTSGIVKVRQKNNTYPIVTHGELTLWKDDARPRKKKAETGQEMVNLSRRRKENEKRPTFGSTPRTNHRTPKTRNG